MKIVFTVDVAQLVWTMVVFGCLFGAVVTAIVNHKNDKK